jgi:hypothetical protein
MKFHNLAYSTSDPSSTASCSTKTTHQPEIIYEKEEVEEELRTLLK